MSKQLLANTVVVPNSTTAPEVHSANSDPSSTGLSAPVGSLCLRTDVGISYYKATSSSTGWVPLPPGTPSLAAIASSGSASDLVVGTIPASRMPALVGDVTTSVGGTAATIGAGKVLDSMLQNAVAASVFGRGANTAGVPGQIQATSDGQMLTRSSGALSFSMPSPASFYDTITTVAFTIGNFTVYNDIDISLGTNTFVVAAFGGTGSNDLTGFKNGSDGRLLTLYRNDSNTSQQQFIRNASSGSSAANRLLLPEAHDFVLAAQMTATFRYDGSLQRWLLLSTAAM